jgi:hypothetical protein
MLMDIHQRDALSFPHSISDLQRLFPDDNACALYLLKLRWRGGFVWLPERDSV